MKEIEDHFVKCLNFLAARQASLIGELDTVLKDQSKYLTTSFLSPLTSAPFRLSQLPYMFFC